MKQSQCLRVRKEEGYVANRESFSVPSPADGEVLIKSSFSSLNYKDALAVTGKGKILKSFPLIPGIDVAGVVVESHFDRIKVGQPVVVTGCGLGENRDGGYSEYVTVPGSWAIPLANGLSEKDAMIYGTAGFTAALAVYRFKANGQSPEQGPILVTGASGGVGSLAVSMLSKLGFSVHAVTGKPNWKPRLKDLGAEHVVSPDELQLGSRPLESVKYGGAIEGKLRQ